MHYRMCVSMGGGGGGGPGPLGCKEQHSILREVDDFRVMDNSDLQTPSFPKGFVTLMFYCITKG